MATVIIKAGQPDEPKGKAGVVNLVAELLAEGTRGRTSKDISAEIDFIGASIDASAESDYITVSLSVLKKDVHKGFDLLSDMLLNPSFSEAEIERKREQIKGFMKQQEEDPSFLAERAFKKEVFGDYPYGRPVEGSAEIIDGIKREELVKFHSEYFLPDNAILSVAGDLTSGELDALMKKYFSIWRKAEVPSRTIQGIDGHNSLPAPSGKGEKEAVLRTRKGKKIVKIDRDLKQANIIFGNQGISRGNPDYYAAAVMNYIFGGGGFSSRLMQSVRDKMGLVYDIHSYFEAHKKAGTFQISLQTKNESANIAIDEILKQIEKIRDESVSDQELSDAKSYLTGSFSRRLDTNRKIADFLAAVEFHALGVDYVARYPDYINSVTKEDVLMVARKYVNPENYVLVVVAGQEKTMLKY
jgi:zinc protease